MRYVVEVERVQTCDFAASERVERVVESGDVCIGATTGFFGLSQSVNLT